MSFAGFLVEFWEMPEASPRTGPGKYLILQLNLHLTAIVVLVCFFRLYSSVDMVDCSRFFPITSDFVQQVESRGSRGSHHLSRGSLLYIDSGKNQKLHRSEA